MICYLFICHQNILFILLIQVQFLLYTKFYIWLKIRVQQFVFINILLGTRQIQILFGIYFGNKQSVLVFVNTDRLRDRVFRED